MFKKLMALTLYRKLFLVLTGFIVLVFVLLYSANLFSALTMDKSSYECTEDSMMKIICDDPYGSSITWTLITLVVVGWPLVVAWFISGLIVLLRLAHIRFKSFSNKNTD